MQKEKYGYLGPAGTFSEMALVKYLDSSCDFLPCTTIREIIDKIKKREIAKGIIPLENSLEGSVNASMDLLLKESDITIIDEVILPIEHHLYAPPGVSMDQIKEILSHRQVIAQTGEFVYNNLPGVKISYTESSAAAAEIVVDNDEKKAMIGSRRIEDLYNLNMLAENIEDNSENHTRFVVVAPAGEERQKDVDLENDDLNQDLNYDQYKTSLICTPEVNRPGVLYEILGEFANRGINLTRIESRPTKKKLGEYLFFIDLEGHKSQPELLAALNKVRKKSGLFKILGSYVKGNLK